MSNDHCYAKSAERHNLASRITRDRLRRASRMLFVVTYTTLLAKSRRGMFAKEICLGELLRSDSLEDNIPQASLVGYLLPISG
nr:hypothetical protein CFP56_11295 [Quercus suber]